MTLIQTTHELSSTPAPRKRRVGALTHKTSIRFYEGDMKALASLFPDQSPQEVVRVLVRRAIREVAAKRGLPIELKPVASDAPTLPGPEDIL